ncbi:hypothetical protein EXS70_00485 [Candidatus Peribacteria bacterium]|nr:hypothetical protein [Candidatus Peribacteria bacterium]
MDLAKLPDAELAKLEGELSQLNACEKNAKRRKEKMPEHQHQRQLEIKSRLRAHYDIARFELKELLMTKGRDEAALVPLDCLIPPTLLAEEASKPLELNVNIPREEVQALQGVLRTIVDDLSLQKLKHETVVQFLRQSHALNPSFEPDLNTDDPFVLIHRAAIAFNAHLCLPSGTVFFPAKFGSNIKPEFWEGDVEDSSWREFPAPIGESAFAVIVKWKEGGSPGHAVGRYIFIDPRQLYVDAKNSYKRITEKPENPFDVELQQYVRSMTPEEFATNMEGERLLFEEIEHAHDRSYIHEFSKHHPSANEMDIGVEALLAPGARELLILWKQFRTDGIKSSSLYIGIAELSGQVGGTIQQMEKLIRANEKDRAFRAFCNHAAHLEAHREIVRSQGGIDLENPYSAYSICGHRALKDIALSDNSALGIVEACKKADVHPADKALELLKSSYNKNIRSLPDRQSLLH